MYDVTVRLILLTDTLRDFASALIAGKKMNDEIGENVAVKEIMKTISRF